MHIAFPMCMTVEFTRNTAKLVKAPYRNLSPLVTFWLSLVLSQLVSEPQAEPILNDCCCLFLKMFSRPWFRSNNDNSLWMGLFHRAETSQVVTKLWKWDSVRSFTPSLPPLGAARQLVFKVTVELVVEWKWVKFKIYKFYCSYYGSADFSLTGLR